MENDRVKNELRLEMILSTYRDKLQELGEEDFIGWVEKTQFPEQENRNRRDSDKESKNDFTGACFKCGSDVNLESGNGSSWGEYDYDCGQCGHSFTIESKGWELS